MRPVETLFFIKKALAASLTRKNVFFQKKKPAAMHARKKVVAKIWKIEPYFKGGPTLKEWSAMKSCLQVAGGGRLPISPSWGPPSGSLV